MNKEKLIELAKQAGWEYADNDRGFEPLWDFAKLVAAAAVRETSAEYRMGWNDGQVNEREACAVLCEKKPAIRTTLDGPSIGETVGKRLAAAIRARSNT
jgi:hypothetical protein